MDSRYLIPVSRSTRLLSDTAVIMLVAVSIIAPFFSLTLLWISLTVFCYILYCMRLSARYITLTDTALIIHLRLGRKSIPMDKVRSVHITDDIDMDWKLIPIPTLWGRNGTYRTPLLGQFLTYCGDIFLPKTCIVLKNKTLVLTVSNCSGFVKTLKDISGR